MASTGREASYNAQEQFCHYKRYQLILINGYTRITFVYIVMIRFSARGTLYTQTSIKGGRLTEGANGGTQFSVNY